MPPQMPSWTAVELKRAVPSRPANLQCALLKVVLFMARTGIEPWGTADCGKVALVFQHEKPRDTIFFASETRRCLSNSGSMPFTRPHISSSTSSDRIICRSSERQGQQTVAEFASCRCVTRQVSSNVPNPRRRHIALLFCNDRCWHAT